MIIMQRSVPVAAILLSKIALVMANFSLRTPSASLASRESLYSVNTTSMYDNCTNNTEDAECFNEPSWPQWKKTLDFAATVIMASNTVNLMLGMGSATDWRKVISHAWPPVGILIGMAGQFVILPACGAALAWAFKLTPYEAMGVLMVSSCPGGSFSNFFTYWVDGDLALSIVMTTFSSILALGGMPLNLWMYSKIWLDMDDSSPIIIPYATIMKTLVFITAPVAVGMGIRHYRPKIASIVTKISSIIGWLGVISASVIWGILYWSVFAAATPLLYACSFILPFLGFSLAYVFARLMCRTHKVCRTIGIETGSQNMAVALSVILMSFQDPKVKSSMIVFPTLYGTTLLIEMFTGIGLFHMWRRCRQKPDDEYLPVAHTATLVKSSSGRRDARSFTQNSSF